MENKENSKRRIEMAVLDTEAAERNKMSYWETFKAILKEAQYADCVVADPKMEKIFTNNHCSSIILIKIK